MTTFDWTITKLYIKPDQDGLSQVVYAVAWKCEGTDDKFSPSYVAFSEGDVSVPTADPSAFTPYNQLTQEQIWGWIDGQIDKPEIELNLQIRIDQLGTQRDINNALNPALPWV
jgi:hypothetical protein